MQRLTVLMDEPLSEILTVLRVLLSHVFELSTPVLCVFHGQYFSGLEDKLKRRQSFLMTLLVVH